MGLTPHDDGHLPVKVAQRESADAAQIPSLVGHVRAHDDQRRVQDGVAAPEAHAARPHIESYMHRSRGGEGIEREEESNTQSKKIKISGFTSCLKLLVVLSVSASCSHYHSLSHTHIDTHIIYFIGTFLYIIPYITQLPTLTLIILTNHLTLTQT